MSTPSTPPSCIMLMRHAEKPSRSGQVKGVNTSGTEDADALSVRGWQRAGALVRFFAPSLAAGTAPVVATPEFLFAPEMSTSNRSKRSKHTLMPLAEFLRKPICTDFAKGQERTLATQIRALSEPVLVVWTRQSIHLIANELTGNAGLVPQEWPEDRFDLVWVFSRVDSGWSFRQMPQLLLAGDSAQPIA